jgi:hypothetical protein
MIDGFTKIVVETFVIFGTKKARSNSFFPLKCCTNGWEQDCWSPDERKAERDQHHHARAKQDKEQTVLGAYIKYYMAVKSFCLKDLRMEHHFL